MYCPTCGSPVPDTSRFCPLCGSPMGSAQAPQADQGAPRQETVTVQVSRNSPGSYGQGQGGYGYGSQAGQSYGSGYGSGAGQSGSWGPEPTYEVPDGPAAVPQGDPYSAEREVRTDRSLLTYIVLTIVTCGIYGWWFLSEMGKDVNKICEGDGETTTTGGIKLFLLSIVTCGIYQYWWYYSVSDRMCNNAKRYGVPMTENGTTVLLWMVLGSCIVVGPFIGLNIIFKNANKLARAYKGETVTYY